AYHSFAGEVEASNTPTIRRLTLSRRHQLSLIARCATIITLLEMAPSTAVRRAVIAPMTRRSIPPRRPARASASPWRRKIPAPSRAGYDFQAQPIERARRVTDRFGGDPGEQVQKRGDA